MRAVQLRPQLHAALLRLRASIWPIAQAAVAAGLAWYITHDLLDHPAPFFAPIAAAIALSATVGRRWRNAVQMMFGVALGIGVSEVIVRLIGTGALPLTLIVLVTMSVAALFSSMPMFVNQAAASGPGGAAGKPPGPAGKAPGAGGAGRTRRGHRAPPPAAPPLAAAGGASR